MQIAPEAGQFDAPQRHFSGAFELIGTSQNGQLLLFTPLGSIAAHIRWKPQSATLQSDGQTREYPDVSTLLRSVTGAELPLKGLFAWLNGQALEVPGWVVDISRHADGRISAKRSMPSPALDLRIVIEPQ